MPLPTHVHPYSRWLFFPTFTIRITSRSNADFKIYHRTTYHTQTGEKFDVNWEKPWKRVEMIPALQEACGEEFPPATELHTTETNEFLKRMLKKVNVECTPPLTNARMIDTLVGEFLEEKCINPTFITGHPEMMSPLAKYHRSMPGLCERFEAFVCKKEIVNAYTELNDPFEQRLRFLEQASQKDQGDEEAQVGNPRASTTLYSSADLNSADDRRGLPNLPGVRTATNRRMGYGHRSHSHVLDG